MSRAVRDAENARGRVRGKVALVTGAASGIGEACCRLLAREGACVVAADRDQTQGSALALDIAGHGGRAVFVRHDVTSEASWRLTVQEAARAFGRFDILVNCAGVTLAKPFEDTTLDEWRALMAVNLDGVFLGNRYGVRAMRDGPPASIVNISSVNGIVSNPLVAAYSASKGAVRLLTKSVALYCAERRYPIRANSVHPGYVLTPMLKHKSPEELAQLEKLHPLGRLGESDDVAYAVLYLACDESKFVTGSELVVDGGFCAQ